MASLLLAGALTGSKCKESQAVEKKKNRIKKAKRNYWRCIPLLEKRGKRNGATGITGSDNRPYVLPALPCSTHSLTQSHSLALCLSLSFTHLAIFKSKVGGVCSVTQVKTSYCCFLPPTSEFDVQEFKNNP